MKQLLVLALLVLLVACRSGLGPTPVPSPTPQPSQPLVGGIQTHFDSPADPQILQDLRRLGFQVARLDIQRTDLPTALGMIEQTKVAGLLPLVIVRDAGQMLQLPADIDFELRNEPDIEGPSAQTYRGLMHDMARVANGRRIWVGAVSNFHDRGFKYLRELGPIPDNLGVSIHNYGDGQFAPTEQRYAKFISIIGQRPFIITEFGYPTADMSEEESATKIKREFEWWALHGARYSILYQLNDGPNKNQESYGIRRLDGSWKPSAFIFSGQ